MYVHKDNLSKKEEQIMPHKCRKMLMAIRLVFCLFLWASVSPIPVYAAEEIVAWGWNNEGQCTVPSLNTNFVAIAAGGNHLLGLKTYGSIMAWGDNDYGQCILPLPTDFVAIAAGGGHSLGLKGGCLYDMTSDLNDDQKIDVSDFAIMAANWPIDCKENPSDPACVLK
jgi:hypothetical protein